MLTQSDFINIEKQAIAIYENLELEIIEEIATIIVTGKQIGRAHV